MQTVVKLNPWLGFRNIQDVAARAGASSKIKEGKQKGSKRKKVRDVERENGIARSEF